MTPPCTGACDTDDPTGVVEGGLGEVWTSLALADSTEAALEALCRHAVALVGCTGARATLGEHRGCFPRTFAGVERPDAAEPPDQPYAVGLSVPFVARDGRSGALEALVALDDRPLGEHPSEVLEELAFVAALSLGPPVVASVERELDALTRLPDRRLFLLRTQEALDAAAAAGEDVVLLQLDLDDFKDLNSAYGRDVGDETLLHLADRLSVVIPADAVLGRTGGDNFAVVLRRPRGDHAAAVALCTAVRCAFSQPVPVGCGDGHVYVSASVGLASSDGSIGDAPVLLANAEQAMYRAKRDLLPWAFYDAHVDTRPRERLRLIGELRDALARDQLEVHYQPVIDLVTGALLGVEALCRWPLPGGGTVPPDVFIPLAESCGLISEITAFVLDTVLAQTSAWERSGRPLSCAVNLSACCLKDQERAVRLAAALSGRTRWITLEVTESVLADKAALAVIQDLAALGFSVAVDDFGTGYSSLALLKDVPVTTLKIDRAFVRDLDQDPKDLAIITMILQLARALDLDVVAEGLETEQTADLLRAAGVRRAQGYLYGRPMPAAALDAWCLGRVAPQSHQRRATDCRPHRPGARSGVDTAHRVVFHADASELVTAIGPHLRDALADDGQAVVIAGEQQRLALREALPPRRLQRAEREARLLLLDPDEILALVMRGGRVDRERFEEAVGALVRERQARAGVLRVYTVTSAVLRERGDGHGALELETLWSELQQEHFELVCSYPLGEDAGPAGIDEVCARHTSIHDAGASDLEDGGQAQVTQVLLDSTRDLLRISTSEDAVGVLLRAVATLGGQCLPATMATGAALPLDLSLGQADPVLPFAPPGSEARRTLESVLPALVEDARTAGDLADSLTRLAAEADTDPLTGLGNRRSLEHHGRLRRSDSVAMLDLDHFKRVNDTEGHDAGDRLLVAFSRAMRQHLRTADRVFRLGGEEFLVVLPDTSPDTTMVVLERLRLAWQGQRPLPVTFSAGIAGLGESAEGDLFSALLRADSALYAAKGAGRDRFVLAHSLATGTQQAAH